MMSRKFCQALAKALGQAYDKGNLTIDYHLGYIGAIIAMETVLKSDNPRFDEARFEAAFEKVKEKHHEK